MKIDSLTYYAWVRPVIATDKVVLTYVPLKQGVPFNVLYNLSTWRF